jgi:two-component sensor histidine kinase
MMVTRQWLWIASIWFAFGLIDASQTVFTMRTEGMHHAWLVLFGVTIVSWLPWALASPVVVSLTRNVPLGLRRPASSWLVHLCACAVINALFSGWTTLLEELFNPYAVTAQLSFPVLWYQEFWNDILTTPVLYTIIVAVSYAVASRERFAAHQTETARLNEQLSNAQLAALRRQIEPHFLFNSLNAIAGLVRSGESDAAVRTIAVLSDFLRRTIEDVARQNVPLRDELEFAQQYLDIQKVRFGDRLQLRFDVPRELQPAQVPSLILQPLVENAVKHGIAKHLPGGEVAISASQRNGKLTLTVWNDGPGLAADWRIERSGIGLANVRTRLQSLYGAAFELDLRNGLGGVEAVVSLPFSLAAVRGI